MRVPQELRRVHGRAPVVVPWPSMHRLTMRRNTMLRRWKSMFQKRE